MPPRPLAHAFRTKSGETGEVLAADAGDGLVPGGEAGGAHRLVEGGQEAVFAFAQGRQLLGAFPEARGKTGQVGGAASGGLGVVGAGQGGAGAGGEGRKILVV